MHAKEQVSACSNTVIVYRGHSPSPKPYYTEIKQHAINRGKEAHQVSRATLVTPKPSSPRSAGAEWPKLPEHALLPLTRPRSRRALSQPRAPALPEMEVGEMQIELCVNGHHGATLQPAGTTVRLVCVKTQ